MGTNNVCYYDAEEKSWFKILNLEVEDGVFKDVEAIACDPSVEEFSKYIIPGFIDAHCHLLENPYGIKGEKNVELSYFCASPNIALHNLLTACQSGITSIKDLGGNGFSSINVMNKLNMLKISRVYTSGCYFTSPGGHCSNHGAIVITCIKEFIRHIDNLVLQNIQFCKIIHGDNGFDKKLLKNMIDVAHEQGMLVSCHAYTEKAAYEAVIAGTDILEHAGDYSELLLDEIEQRNIIIVPTYVSAVDSTPENCEVLSDVDENVIFQWLSGEKKVIPKLFHRNINVAIGSDSGFLGTPCNSLIREMQLLHKEFGISVEKILYSAYVVTPKTIRMDGRLGKISKGFYADYLCYYNNPLIDINILGYPNEVWVNGNRIDNLLANLVRVQKLGKEDIPNLSMYLQNYYFDCGTLEDYWTEEEIENWIADECDCCVGAFWHDELIGFCLTHYHSSAKKIHLENIFVVEEYRKQGVAQRLLMEVMLLYSDKTSKARFVGLVETNNHQSIQLLNKNSFTKGHPMYWMQSNITHE